MKTHAFRAMNTDWWIAARGLADLDAAERTVRDIESRLSRFLPHSSLTRLNRERRVSDPILAAVVGRALEIRRATDGAFDVGVGSALVAAGYDRSFELLANPRAPAAENPRPALLSRPSVDVRGVEVSLSGEGLIDLGGIAKGWTVDLVAGVLEASGAQGWFVDGGGDIRVGGVTEDGGCWPVGVANGLPLCLDSEAVCTSSVTRRRWQSLAGPMHHIIDMSTGLPSCSGFQTAVVVARDATSADALATAILADPRRGLRAVSACGAEVLVERGGCWGMTPGMERYFS